MQPRQFSGGLLGEDPKHEQLPRFIRHWTFVEGRDMSENCSIGSVRPGVFPHVLLNPILFIRNRSLEPLSESSWPVFVAVSRNIVGFHEMP
jgi:hypothetical protein